MIRWIKTFGPFFFSICLNLVLVNLVLFSLASSELSAQEALKVPAQIAKPSNARELMLLRKFYDQTVWRDERLAEQYERWIVGLWNSFLYTPDKWSVIAGASVDELIVGQPKQAELIDWDISKTQFEQPKKLNSSQWKALANQLKDDGYQIIETEWHHSEFIPAKQDQPAKSVVSMQLHVTRPKTNERYIVRGDLKFVWSSQKQGKTFLPASIDVSDVVVLQRQGKPAFQEVFTKKYKLGAGSPMGTVAIHPVMLHDLNGDQLPEVVVAGQNKVFWNKGDWKFEEADSAKTHREISQACARGLYG